MSKVFLGIDPGSVNLGWALVTEDGSLKDSGFLNPSIIGLADTVNTLSSYIPDKTEPVVCIERYVAYKGVMNQASEQILMLIGALVYEFERRDETVLQFRAIDWKPNLCKYMYKLSGFKNPEKTFNKKYSMAMAEALTGSKPKTDHEADAICLAYYGQKDVGSNG